MRHIRPLALLVSATLAYAPMAFAHAFLQGAIPPVGSDVDASPQALTLTFTEGVEPLFSTVVVNDQNGTAVATGKAHVAADNNRRLIVDLPTLPPGTYTVIWHVTSVDTHKTEGNYKFTVVH